MANKIYNQGKIYAGGFSINLYDGVPVGFVGWFAANEVPECYYLCDGSLHSRVDDKELFDAIGTTFGAGDGSTTFNVPNLIDRVAWGSTEPGTVKEAGLPNIRGKSFPMRPAGTEATSGALYTQTAHVTNCAQGTGDSGTNGTLYLDASRYNDIYGKSETVQPPALTLLPCIKAKNKAPVTEGDGGSSSGGDTSSDSGMTATVALSNIERRVVEVDLKGPEKIYPKAHIQLGIPRENIKKALILQPNEHILGGDDVDNYIEVRVEYGYSAQRSIINASYNDVFIAILNPSDDATDSLTITKAYFTYFIYKTE